MSDNRENKHNEEPHDSEEEKYSFLQETVKDEQRSKKGIMGNLCRLAGRGLIFGLAAGLAFYALRPWAMTHLGGEKVTIPLDQEETPVENETDTKDQEAQEEEIQYPDLTVEDYQEMNHALYQVALSAGKSVVEIYAVHRDEGWVNAGGQVVSGVIFWDNGADLLIAAPARIVKDAEALKATFSDNTTYNATLKKQDRNLGLAIIAIKRSDLSDSTRNQIQTAMLGNSNAVNRGDGVIVLGEQFGYAGGVGYGIISSTRNYRTVADGQYRLLDTDIAGSEKGSGILFNTAGEVIGICDQSELQRDGNLVSAYAISDIKEEIELLANGQGVPYIGVHGVVVTEKLAGEQGIPKGIYVREVEADSPAMQAGIQNGDVITEINKTDITGITGLHKQIAEAGTGTQIRIKGQRRGADGYVDVTFDVTVGSKE